MDGTPPQSADHERAAARPASELFADLGTVLGREDIPACRTPPVLVLLPDPAFEFSDDLALSENKDSVA